MANSIPHKQIDSQAVPAVLQLGFRPFFLGALIFAQVTVVWWVLVYSFSLPLPMTAASPFHWHAHEMIYGYSLAVVAGFLLTAVRNWTGNQTVCGWPLLGLLCLWAAARISMLAGTALIYSAVFFDVLFSALLIASVAAPIFRAKKWKQLGILLILVMIGAGNISFYLGCFGYLESGIYWGIYGGLYLVIGLILTIGRRVIPFFIESGVGYPVKLLNNKWVDSSSLILFLALLVVDVFFSDKRMVPFLAAALFAVNLVRLAGWYTHGIWNKALLWSLYIAYQFVVAGFLLLSLSGFTGVSGFIAVHSFAYGGIGLVTMSMMTRVSLGHTARDVNGAHSLVSLALMTLVVGAFFRIVPPLVYPDYYLAWIVSSQLLWLGAFAIITVFLVPILIAPRLDGRYG